MEPDDQLVRVASYLLGLELPAPCHVDIRPARDLHLNIAWMRTTEEATSRIAPILVRTTHRRVPGGMFGLWEGDDGQEAIFLRRVEVRLAPKGERFSYADLEGCWSHDPARRRVGPIRH